TLADGTTKYAATIYDLMLSQYGVNRFDSEFEAEGYDDEESVYSPAWQEKITSVKQSVVVQIAREFAQNAVDTDGRSMIIMGAGINHWLNSDTIYRAILNLVMLCGCVGKNGGGWAHYVGQEKVRPDEGWGHVDIATDWQRLLRQQYATRCLYLSA